jgi:hypothetical protein
LDVLGRKASVLPPSGSQSALQEFSMRRSVLVLVLLCLVSSLAFAQKFRTQVPYSTGAAAPNGVAIGDLNGDGHLDVVVANSSVNGTVAVLLGKGTGTLQAAVTYPAGSYPEFVVLADFNHDGHLDVAVGNRAIGTSGYVNILLGNGDGTLQGPVAYGPFVDAFSMAVADFNGDGNLDIAVGDTSSGSILLGNGDGTFHFGNPIGFTDAVFFAVADFNRDGKLDLAAANNLGSSVSILYGDGTGNFTSHASYSTATPPIALAAADLNGDGIPDVAIAGEAVNNLNSNLTVLESSGTRYTKKKYPYGDEPREVLAVDINGDGLLDLVAENEFNGTVDLFVNKGSGIFGAPMVLQDGAVTAASVAVGDLNGDGKLDIVVSDGEIPGHIHVLLQR